MAGDGSSDKVLQFPCQWLFRELGHPTDVCFFLSPAGLNHYGTGWKKH